MARWIAACGVLAVAALGSYAVGGQAVVFQDGRSLRTESVLVRDGQVILTLEGGGRIAVPRARVKGWGPVASRRPAASSAAGHTTVSSPWREVAGPYAEIIGRVADEHGIDPALLTSMAHVESAFDPGAVSPKGAQGLLQLMPATAERFGVEDVFDARQNVEGGARYLNWLLERYAGRTDLALAGYNAGEGAVDRHRGIPPYPETRDYVTRVLHGAERLARPAGAIPLD